MFVVPIKSLCFNSVSPKKPSKKVSSKPPQEDPGKYKSAEFVETDESSSEDEKPEKKLKRNKKEVRFKAFRFILPICYWYMPCLIY